MAGHYPDGCTAADIPGGPEFPAHAQESEDDAMERADRRALAGAGAIGLLGALLDLGDLPPHHTARARSLIADWHAGYA